MSSTTTYVCDRCDTTITDQDFQVSYSSGLLIGPGKVKMDLCTPCWFGLKAYLEHKHPLVRYEND